MVHRAFDYLGIPIFDLANNYGPPAGSWPERKFWTHPEKKICFHTG